MEKNSFYGRHNTFRALSRSLSPSRLFFWNRNNKSFPLGNNIGQRGFTLIELITAIGVLAVLSSAVLAVVNPLDQFYKSLDSRRKSDLAQVQRGLEVYYQDNHRYPPVYQYKISGDGTSGTVVNWGSDWRPYMDVLPIDPNSNKSYGYWTDSTGQSYALYASLDRGSKDPQACNSGAACSNASSNGVTCGSGVCSYGITSPNIAP